MSPEAPPPVNPARYRRAREVFDAVVELAPDARSQAVLDACGDDRDLQTTVLRLLSHDSKESPLDEVSVLGVARMVAQAAEAGEAPPDTIGPYAITAEVFRGEHGSVYRGQDRQQTERLLHRCAAPVGSIEAVAAFVAAFEAAGRVADPVLPRAIDRTHHEGAPVVITEDARGMGLLQVVFLLDLPARVALVARVARAVDALHAQGACVGGLSTETVRVGPSGDPRLWTVGCGRTVAAQPAAAIHLSPEERDGEAPSPATDRYRLGVIAWCALAGRLPDRTPPGPLPDHVPAPYRAVVSAMLDPDPAVRTAHARDFARDLEQASAQADADTQGLPGWWSTAAIGVLVLLAVAVAWLTAGALG